MTSTAGDNLNWTDRHAGCSFRKEDKAWGIYLQDGLYSLYSK